jgi:hypothetical protein
MSGVLVVLFAMGMWVGVLVEDFSPYFVNMRVECCEL